MSYYSSFIFELDHPKVDPVQIKAMEKRFADKENNKLRGFFKVELPVDSKNKLIDIGLEDYYGKFYDDQLFAEELSKCLIGGAVSLKFNYEDGDGGSCAYLVTSKKVEDLVSVYMTTSIFADFSRWLAMKKRREI